MDFRSPHRCGKPFCSWLNISESLWLGYHSQSNGQLKCLNQEIKRFLRIYCSKNQRDWSHYFTWSNYAQNLLTNSSTGLPMYWVSNLHFFPVLGNPVMSQQSTTGWKGANSPGTLHTCSTCQPLMEESIRPTSPPIHTTTSGYLVVLMKPEIETPIMKASSCFIGSLNKSIQ